MLELSIETKEDWWEVEALFDHCFAPGREALSSYRLRDDVPPIAELCLVVRDDFNVIGGAVRFWPVTVGGKDTLLLGPIAVHPTRQGEGLGGFLMRESLRHATDLGWTRVMLVGDASYYNRFDFTKLEEVIMPPPTNPDRVLGKELEKGEWENVKGTVEKKNS